MTLEQFKEKVKNYEICRSADDSIYTDEHMQSMAHEIVMNAMDVLKTVAEAGYREGCEDTISELSSSLLPGAIRCSTKHKWLNSDTRGMLEE